MRAAVIVGLDNATGLPGLSDAVGAAERFEAWAKKEKFDSVKLLTDAGDATVRLDDILTAVTKAVNGDYDQLVIYFSGHGFLKTSASEFWVLSNGMTNANEAVDLSASIELARDCGIPHVIFISDACRSLPPTFEVSRIQGGVIFPLSDSAPLPRASIDLFYATLPGDVALEVKNIDDAVDGHKAVFTSCLLEGLKGELAELREMRYEEGKVFEVVPAWTLQPYLEREVPVTTASRNVTLLQNPEIRILSRTPKYLATVVLPPGGWPSPRPGDGPPAPPTRQQARRRVVANEIRGVMNPGWEAAGEPSDNEKAFTGAMQPERDRVVNASRRPAFETRTGYTIVGAKLGPDALPNGAGYEVLEEGGLDHVRIYDPTRSVVIRFEDGRGTCLPPMPGYVGSVQVEDGRIVAVNYTPSQGTERYGIFEAIRAEIEEHRSFVAVATRHGVFDLASDDERQYGNSLRRWKGVDPSLGIYATYAYAASGMVEEIRSIADAMKHDLREARDDVNMQIPDGRDVMIYDVALYGRQIVADQSTPDGALVLPCCPMMTQGWGFAAAHTGLLPEALSSVRGHLIPALWTTLDPEGMKAIMDAFERGDIR